jgi:hypothetical protein
MGHECVHRILRACDFCNYAITCVISLGIFKTAYVGTFYYVLYIHTVYTFLAFYIKEQEIARNVQCEAVFLVEDANNEVKSAMGRTADQVYIRLYTVLVTKWGYSRMQYSNSHQQWVCYQNASRDLCQSCSMYKMIHSEK